VPGSFDLPIADKAPVLALAQHRRDVLVGIAAPRGGPIEVVGLRAEHPVPVAILLDGREAETTSCGNACYELQAPVFSGRKLTLRARAGSDSFRFALPARMPPSGAAVLGRARRTMAALRSYHFTERLTSGGPTVFSRLDVESPNRLQLKSGPYRAVIIGHTRWDYRAGRWERTSFPGLNAREVLMWYHARNPRIVGREADGRVQVAAFGLQPVPAWFRLTVEPSGRVTRARMTAASHFMLHRYSAFDHGVAIKPPR
jgi:hypothetical protein